MLVLLETNRLRPWHAGQGDGGRRESLSILGSFYNLGEAPGELAPLQPNLERGVVGSDLCAVLEEIPVLPSGLFGPKGTL